MFCLLYRTFRKPSNDVTTSGFSTLLAVNLRSAVSNLISNFRGLGVLHLVHSRHALGVTSHELPDDLDSRVRTTWLGCDNFARLVDDKDTARRALGRLLQPNGGDERLRRIAQQCVRKLLLRLEGSVCLGAVVREPVDAVAGRSKGLVGVAEEAGLFSA
jgi:hypothetical protein